MQYHIVYNIIIGTIVLYSANSLSEYVLKDEKYIYIFLTRIAILILDVDNSHLTVLNVKLKIAQYSKRRIDKTNKITAGKLLNTC